ncbi:MAG TPA: tetratricopeptide repeat protein [Pyrinomonadaceae bacterium]|nr:tetratricopeptide repeat protein [Pyrinomonadaceae bacterium]
MAVLIEAISVIVRREPIEKLFPGGWRGFLSAALNRTLYSDDEIASVSFMAPDDVKAYIFYLESCGLDFDVGGHTVDISVVDQIRGFTTPSPWLQFGEVEKDGNLIKACWLAGTEPNHVFTPRGWKYEGSLSQKSGFIPTEEMNQKFKFLREENGLEVYLDLQTNEERYIGRPKIPGESREEVFSRLKSLCQEALDLDIEAERARESKNESRGGEIFLRLKEEMLTEAEQIVMTAGRNMAIAHFACGLILRVLKQPADAEAYFRRANDLTPGVSNTILELVRCLGEQEKFDQAVPFAREGVAYEPNNPACLGNLALSLLMIGEKNEARQHLDKALAIDANDPINRQMLKKFAD